MKVEDLFINLPPRIKNMYDELLQKCAEFNKIRTDTTKSCIYFLEGHDRYLAIKPRKTGIILEFILNRKEDVFPVINIFEISKNQIVHRIMLDSIDDINDQVLDWIRDAYLLKMNK